jgi:hypothetical protein
MALTYTRQLLNGGSNGKPISVDATASPGTIIHTVEPTATNAREEIYLYAHLMATSDQRLTVEFGGQATQDHIVQDLVDGDGLHVVVPGLNLTATTSIVRAFATGGAGEISISGWVNRAT